jgi:MATE family multidrug resistance protein
VGEETPERDLIDGTTRIAVESPEIMTSYKLTENTAEVKLLPGSWREVLAVSLPLMMSSGLWAVLHFVDRVFLSRYSPEALAASMPAGILQYTIMAFFLGTIGFSSTFVAQYFGAARPERIGTVIIHGIYLAIPVALLFPLLAPLSGPFFHSLGHGTAVADLETQFFIALAWGSLPLLCSAALGGLYSGLGLTQHVFWVSGTGILVNIGLDYLLIFGNYGFPELGIRGAGYATSIASGLTCLLYVVLLFARGDHRRFKFSAGFELDGDLIRRYLRFGVPGGGHQFFDVIGWTIFILILGRLGTEALAVSNAAFSINTLAFMPAIGFGIGAGILVGQYLGADQPDIAERAAQNSFNMAFGFMVLVALLFFVFPKLFLRPFTGSESGGAILKQGTIILRIIALYTLFDTANVVYAFALRGAGDTSFIMKNFAILTPICLILPVWIGIQFLGMGLYGAWGFAALFVCVLAVSFSIRFARGKWKQMRVIEPQSLIR